MGQKYQQLLIFLMSLGFVVFSFWPTIYEIRRQNDLQDIRAFELIHNFYTDFNFYRSRIRQGLEGNLTVVEKYTSEPHAGSFLHIMYLAMGWVGRMVRVPWGLTSDIYHMARIVLGMTLLLATAAFARAHFRSFWWQVVAFLMAVTASSWPKYVSLGDRGWRFGGYMAWWSVMDSHQRITFLPHLIAGQAMILFLLLQLTNRTVMARWGNWIFLGVLGFVLGIIFPPGLVFMYAVLGMYIILSVLFERDPVPDATEWWLHRIRRFVAFAVPQGVFVFLSSASLLYLSLMTSFYPWKRLAEFDITDPLPFAYTEYLQAMGPVLPLGLLGLLLMALRREKRMLLPAAYVFGWIALLSIFNFIPQQSPLRFSEMTPHIPLAILGAYLFIEFTKTIKRSVEKRQARVSPASYRMLQAVTYSLLLLFYALPLGFIGLGVGQMHSSYYWQTDFIDHKIRASMPLVPTGSYVMYPLKDFLMAITFLQDATSRDTVILSETTAGNYIPVYSGNTVYVGHANTVRKAEKEELVKQFYGGRMKPDQALSWIRENKFGAVFYGPQEKEDNQYADDLAEMYPFLTPAFKNGFVTIYWIRQE